LAKAILLFSGGLDSTLAGLIVKSQGIEVIAVRFITPFFGWKFKSSPQLYEEKIKDLGFDEGILLDITEEYLSLLKNPRYGFGDYANPCIDCKIFLLKKAKSLLQALGSEFLVTGEVQGQRPMSQNKNALELIEREAGVEGLLVRPLSAKLLKETEPEKKGLIKREYLYDHQGRRRDFQFELAKRFGLKEIPTPAGGCLLTDPIIGSRVLRVIKEKRTLNPLTAELLVLGRHYFVEDCWFVLGRREEENETIKKIAIGHFPLYTLSEPSPLLAVIEGNPSEKLIEEYLFKHSKKAQAKRAQGGEVSLVKVRA